MKNTKNFSHIVNNQIKIVLDILEEMKWPRTARANVIRERYYKKNKRVGYEGFVLGLVTTWAAKVHRDAKLRGSHAPRGMMLSAKTRDPKYKKLYKEAKKLMKLKNPNFKFTSIQFNKNNRAAKHKDSKNMGVSYIVGMGDYTGGQLIIYDKNGKNPVKHDIKGKFKKFNGSIYPHETRPFKGERYTLVFYSIR